MRSFRIYAAAFAAMLIVPALAGAQARHNFSDSWFWGAKGGLASFSTETVDNKVAPLVGAEWLITRQRFGLYIAVDETFFDETSSVSDFQGGSFGVQVKNLRRFTAAGLIFPKQYGSVRPYAGLGFTLNFIGEAGPTDSFSEPSDENFVRSEIDDRKDRPSFLAMVGAQAQLGSVSPFVQASYQPSHINFLLSGRPAYFLEAGVRVNVASAIER